MSLYINEDHNAYEEGVTFDLIGWEALPHGLGSSGIYESFTDNPGELFRSLSREYGRCTGRVYVDDEDGRAKPIVWIFVKRQPYEDEPERTYLHEVWVTLHERKPDVVTTYHYAEV